MKYLLFILLVAGAWFFGLFAFAQIIGCIKTKSHMFSFLLWLGLLTVVSVLVLNFLSNYITAYAIGLIISFIQIIFTPNIE